MKKASLGKIGPVLLGSYILSFLMLFFFSLIFPSPGVMKYFYLDNAVKWALHYFIEFLIPIHSTAILLIYSLFIDTGMEMAKKGSLIRNLVSSVLVLFLILTVLYIICLLWFQPQIISGIQENEIKSEMALNYYSLATSEVLMSDNVIGKMKEKHLRNAFQYIESCLRLNPKYDEAEILESKIRKKIIDIGVKLTEEEISVTKSDMKQNRDFIEGLDADGLMKKAWELFEKEDFFSAYYYASMAFHLDNTRIDAESLLTRAMNKINSYELTLKDEGIRKLYQKKKEGYNKIVSGEYVAAYYLFKELEAQFPDDPDIKDYLLKIKEEFIGKLTFFYEDVKNIDSQPGKKNIIFINHADEEKKQFIYIEKMVNVREGIFFRNTEIITISHSGEVLSHFKAPFGKYVYVDISYITKMQNKRSTKHHINFNCIRKEVQKINTGMSQDDDNNIDIFPYYLTRPKEETGSPDFIIPLYPPWHLLDNFQAGNASFHRTGLLELFSLSINKEYENAGFNRTDINIEIITRFILPFLFLFCSLLAIALGWTCRSRYQRRPPLITFLFIPLFPVVVALLVKLYLITQSILFGFIIILLGIIPTLFICLVFQSVVIIIALIFVAGKLTQ